MLKYKERLDELSIDVYNKFNDLIEEYGEFNFALKIVEEEIRDLHDIDEIDFDEFLNERDLFVELPTIEFRNDITGNVFDVHVMRIAKGVIYCVNMNDTSISYIFKFSDIAGIYNKITLLTDMDNLK